MKQISSHRKNTKQLIIIGVIGLVIILFTSFNLNIPNNNLSVIPNVESHTQLPIHASAIKNVTKANLSILYPATLNQYYIEPLNGFGSGTVENLKNETGIVNTNEMYPSSDYGNVYVEVSFDTSGLDISSMTLFRINWEGQILSTTNSVIGTKLNIYIDNQGSYQLLHNATNTGGGSIERKIGWWEHKIPSNFQNYISGNIIKLKFEAEQTLTAPESNWHLYLLLYWSNVIFGKDIEFTRVNATAIQLIYNDTNYEQIGNATSLENDEDGDILSIKINETASAGRNNITFDVVFDLLNFSLDDIYGFTYCHDDWFAFNSGTWLPQLGTISVQNTSSGQLFPIQYLRDAHLIYDNLYPRQGYAAYTFTDTGWFWNQSELRLRYYRNITGVTNWATIEIDLGYIEIARRTGPIFSVDVENDTRYINEVEYVHILVQNYRSKVTDIRVFSSEGNTLINDTEGNYTFEVTRITSGWYNFSVQIIDNEEHLVTKGQYKIWFNGRPVRIDITLDPIPEEIRCTLIFTDSIFGAPVPNKEFDLWIYKYGETIPYASFPGLTTNASGMFIDSYSVIDNYLDETYTFNITTYADASYSRCSVTTSVTCKDAPPSFTITDVVYNSQYSGGTVTIDYKLENWGLDIVDAYLRENGIYIMHISTNASTNQISFETKSGNNNYTFWAKNNRSQIGESEIINLNLKLKPINLDILTFYIDGFFYFFIDVKDNETGSSLDGVPVHVSVYDSGFLLFSGQVETHSMIIGGFPFDTGLDHHFLFRAQVIEDNLENRQKESQLPFRAYPLNELLTFGLIALAILGVIIFPRLLGKKRRSKRKRHNRQN